MAAPLARVLSPDLTPTMSDAAEFVDEATVHVRGGRGGNGAVSFRREAHVPRGGPDGGDGGPGGDVALVADPDVTSLLDLKRYPHRRGEDGGHGEGNNRTGAAGDDLRVSVPVGTVVRDWDTGDVVADLVDAGEAHVVATGGRGGRGNASFASNRWRAPRFAERGEVTDERTLRLELKLIADVGLVGFPSAGKSSLISRLSAAKPRVETWPFTTLTPHLGMMRAGSPGEATDVVIADVPGLVEGASDGRGLGHEFLRHVERCAALVHVLDTVPFDPERDPIRDLDVVLGELDSHRPELLERPAVVVLNKIDVPDGRAMVDLVRGDLEDDGWEVLATSAVTGEGVDALKWRLAEIVAREREAGRDVPTEETQPDDEYVIRFEEDTDRGVEVSRDATGAYVVTGTRVERWVQMTPLDNPQAVNYLQGRLRRAGVDRALTEAGAREGDEVVIGEAVFEFTPELEDLPEDERQMVLAGEEGEVEDARSDVAGGPGDVPAGGNTDR